MHDDLPRQGEEEQGNYRDEALSILGKKASGQLRS
jgi:hypothetical protein